MAIRVLKEQPIKIGELQEMAHETFGDFVKGVVDVEQGIMAMGGEFHSDEEVVLMEREYSKREHTWGINLYPDKPEEEFIEFDSMINLKPWLSNRSRGVENPEIREKIKTIVEKLVLR